VPQHAQAEDERWPDASSTLDVERHPRADGDHAHSTNPGILPALPLAQRQVRDLVTLLGKPFAEIAVPALGPADGMGIEAVVDETDTHRSLTLASNTAVNLVFSNAPYYL
jgi:hypothetical protein